MIELSNFKKNKINLEDYDYRKDIENRKFMAQFSTQDVQILEEILYSPIRCSIESLADSLEMEAESLKKKLVTFEKTGLFVIEGDVIVVDKDTRKYFETQILKFEEDFTPGMEFLQSLLKKVPIHVLPNWYPIPRTSNNIFDSLVEKYLITPQTFQRYLTELNLGDEVLSGIVDDVFRAENYALPSSDLMQKYNLSQEQFEEAMLQLEFNFVCCLVYERQGDEWKEMITLFHEWKEYLCFLKNSEPRSLEEASDLLRHRTSDFAFVEDLSALLTSTMKAPFALRLSSQERWETDGSEKNRLEKLLPNIAEDGADITAYTSHLIHKALFLKLVRIEGSTLTAIPLAEEWLSLPKEKRALAAYKHTLQQYPYNEYTPELASERNIREIEKSITRIIEKGWVYYSDFMQSILCQISEESKIILKKKGRSWHYTQPVYTENEQQLIKQITYDWMFEAGIIAKAMHAGKPCIAITPFGKSIFGS